ncbi:redox-active disulfide protein 2 [Rudanella paleaurantiibacter]|uniref:Redox-active disulfide protein 2 n=1 Tax=Rudanella paleaurantiibacter TaxID=2614655 RepID=A0A7J5TU26_9BACT|nr:redox-active disulfide protein 2 [Rudanella paleaurantiibacter]KAB7725725.1 redox-active disulfide protein 2 [Rudanella paleaurantiibacter]
MSQKIQDLSDEALLKRKKTTVLVTGILAGMLVALLILAINLSIKENSSVGLPLMIMPFALSPILFLCINDIRAVKKELQTRNRVI